MNRELVTFIRGSRAYGTENEHSDLDTTMIFLEDIYAKATLYPKYKFNHRENITDNSVIELGRVVERVIACDSAYIEYCFRDLVMEETPYTKLYFELMDELIAHDLFNEKVLCSRGAKHFRDEQKRMLKILGFTNLKKTQKMLYQNLRIEKMLESILNNNPVLKYTGKDLEYLKHYKYDNFTEKELITEINLFYSRWESYEIIPPIEKREKELDEIYISYLRKFDES